MLADDPSYIKLKANCERNGMMTQAWEAMILTKTLKLLETQFPNLSTRDLTYMSSVALPSPAFWSLLPAKYKAFLHSFAKPPSLRDTLPSACRVIQAGQATFPLVSSSIKGRNQIRYL